MSEDRKLFIEHKYSVTWRLAAIIIIVSASISDAISRLIEARYNK